MQHDENLAAERPTFVTHLECSETGEHYPADEVHNLSCVGKPLLVRYDLDGVRRALTKDALSQRPADLWRYRELLPKLEAYWATYPNYDQFLKFVKVYSRRMELAVLEQETQVRPCHAGLVSGVLDARGEVRMCELRDAVGNVRDTNYDFTKVWFNEAADAQRIAICNKECHCTHSCFMSSSLVFDVRTYGAWLASTVVNFLSAA